MAAQTNKSRWGSFLSQAVAGVEARLDTLLADDDSSAAKQPKPANAAGPVPQQQVKPGPGAYALYPQ
jgi:TATA element modulatory factor